MITYESGSTLIGGCPDLECGIYQIQQSKTYIQQAEDIINKYVPGISFDDGVYSRTRDIDGKEFNPNIDQNSTPQKPEVIVSPNVIIKNGKLIKFNNQLCGDRSRFMTFVTYHYGASVALNMLDEFTRFIY